MKRVATPLEILGCVLMLILGLFLLYDGTINQAPAILIGGAICLTLGVTLLVPAVRNFRWHRRMLHDSLPDQKTDLD